MNEHYNMRVNKYVSEQEFLEIEIEHFQNNYKLPLYLAQDVAVKIISLADAIRIMDILAVKNSPSNGGVVYD